MTDETNTAIAGDEISLLDLLLVVAENARLLIFGPLIAGVAGATGLNVGLASPMRSRARKAP